MHFIFLQQAGKPVENSSGKFWCLAGLAVQESKWKTLQTRLAGLQKSFQRRNYKAGLTRLNANDLLHPRNATRPWSLALTKGVERVVASLNVKIFLVVVDKATTDKPAHPKWLLPLSYHYVLRPITQYLRENQSPGTLVVPAGREDERQLLTDLQAQAITGSAAKSSWIVGSPMVQTESESLGLQVADLIATIARRYHEDVYPKLFAKQILEGYDAVINSHYQGFVKPNTYQSLASDARGYRIRGYIYLWRRDAGTGAGQVGDGGDEQGGIGSESRPNYGTVSEAQASYGAQNVAEEQAPYGTGAPRKRPSPRLFGDS